MPKRFILTRQLAHFFKMDPVLRSRVLHLQKLLSEDDDSNYREEVNKDAESCRNIYEQCCNDEGWKVVSDRDNSSLRVLYRHDDRSVHSIKYSANLECSVAEIVSIAREFDLIADWNKHVKQSAILEVPKLFKLVAYGSIYFPWHACCCIFCIMHFDFF